MDKVNSLKPFLGNVKAQRVKYVFPTICCFFLLDLLIISNGSAVCFELLLNSIAMIFFVVCACH